MIPCCEHLANDAATFVNTVTFKIPINIGLMNMLRCNAILFLKLLFSYFFKLFNILFLFPNNN
jgi:hypothetical protein